MAGVRATVLLTDLRGALPPKAAGSIEIDCEICGTGYWLRPEQASVGLSLAEEGLRPHFHCKKCMIKIHAGQENLRGSS